MNGHPSPAPYNPDISDANERIRKLEEQLAAKSNSGLAGILTALSGKKTYIAAFLTAVVCIAEMLGYDVVPGIDQGNAMQTLLTAVFASTIRDGIAKTGATP